MSRYLITGANGFVGSALCTELSQRGFTLRAAVRRDWEMPRVETVHIPSLEPDTDWQAALQDIGVVVHSAARVHVMRDKVADPLAEFRRTNVAATENLARQAAQAGVKRLVFISSIKVNGEGTAPGQVYTEADLPAPQDPYGVSKWEAEQMLQRVSAETGLEVVIVRPPLMYGPEVKGNFLTLLKAVEQECPLPLAAANDNARSLLYLGNFVDAVLACARHPAAAGQTYLVSDGQPVSTVELIAALATALGHRNPAFYCPPGLLYFAAKLLRRQSSLERLFGSLHIDDSKIRQQLGWKPPYSIPEGLQATADWYRALRPSLP